MVTQVQGKISLHEIAAIVRKIIAHSWRRGITLVSLFRRFEATKYFKQNLARMNPTAVRKRVWMAVIKPGLKMFTDVSAKHGEQYLEEFGVGIMAFRSRNFIHCEHVIMDQDMGIVLEDLDITFRMSREQTNLAWGHQYYRIERFIEQVEELLYFVTLAGEDGITKSDLKKQVEFVGYINKAMSKAQAERLVFSFRPVVGKVFRYANQLFRDQVNANISVFDEDDLLKEFSEVFTVVCQVFDISKLMYHDVFDLMKKFGKSKFKKELGKDLNYYSFRDMMFRNQMKPETWKHVVLSKQASTNAIPSNVVEYWVVRKNTQNPFQEYADTEKKMQIYERAYIESFSKAQHFQGSELNKIICLVQNAGPKGVKLSEIAFLLGYSSRDTIYTKRYETTLLSLGKSPGYKIENEPGKLRGRMVFFTNFMDSLPQIKVDAPRIDIDPPEPQDSEILQAMEFDLDPLVRVKTWDDVFDKAKENEIGLKRLRDFVDRKLKEGFGREIFDIAYEVDADGTTSEGTLVKAKGDDPTVIAQLKKDIRRRYSSTPFMEIIKHLHLALFNFEKSLKPGFKMILGDFEKFISVDEFLLLASTFQIANPKKLLIDIEKKRNFYDVRSDHTFYTRTFRTKLNFYIHYLLQRKFLRTAEQIKQQRHTITVHGGIGRLKKERTAYELEKSIKLPTFAEVSGNHVDDGTVFPMIEFPVTTIEEIDAFYLHMEKCSRNLQEMGYDEKCFDSEGKLQVCVHQNSTCPFTQRSWTTPVSKAMQRQDTKFESPDSVDSRQKTFFPTVSEVVMKTEAASESDVDADVEETEEDKNARMIASRSYADILAQVDFDMDRFKAKCKFKKNASLPKKILNQITQGLPNVGFYNFYDPEKDLDKLIKSPATSAIFTLLLTQLRTYQFIYTDIETCVQRYEYAIMGFEKREKVFRQCLLALGCHEMCSFPNIFKGAIEVSLMQSKVRDTFWKSVESTLVKVRKVLTKDNWLKGIKKLMEESRKKRLLVKQKTESSKPVSRFQRLLQVNPKARIAQSLSTMPTAEVPEMLRTRKRSKYVPSSQEEANALEQPEEATVTRSGRKVRKIDSNPPVVEESEETRRSKRAPDDEYLMMVERTFLKAGQAGLKLDDKLRMLNFMPLLTQGKLIKVAFYDHYRIVHFTRAKKWLLFTEGSSNSIRNLFLKHRVKSVKEQSSESNDMSVDENSEASDAKPEEELENNSTESEDNDATDTSATAKFVVPRIWTSLDGKDNVALQTKFRQLTLAEILKKPGCTAQHVYEKMIRVMFPVDVDTITSELVSAHLIEKHTVEGEDGTQHVFWEPNIKSPKKISNFLSD